MEPQPAEEAGSSSPRFRPDCVRLERLSRNERFLLCDLPDDAIEECLLQMELQDDLPSAMLGIEEDPSEPPSVDNELARSMSDRLDVLQGPGRLSPLFAEAESEWRNFLTLQRKPLNQPRKGSLTWQVPQVFHCLNPLLPLPLPLPLLTVPSPLSTPELFIIPPPLSPSPVTPPPTPFAEIPVVWNHQPPDSRPAFSFTGNPGLKVIPNSNSPPDYFSLMFPQHFFQMLVKETNDFAVVSLLEKASALGHRSRIGNWKNVDEEETKKFLGLFFLTGAIKISRWSEYWSTEELFRIPIFTNTMGRDRFLAILSCLHFASNPDPDQAPSQISPIHKILPILEQFEETMKNVHEAAEILCINESMAPWRGRLRFRQFMAGKSHKYSVKLYMVTESDGLVHRIIVYAGAADREVAGPGHAKKVVNKLMTDFMGFGRSLFMDNFYNSVDLTRELLAKNIQVSGTLRANRKHNPVEVVKARLLRGESVQRWFDEGINVTKWRDRRDVLTISSEFSGDVVTTSNRRGQQLSKPEVVLKYNGSMGSIDRCDQLLAYYMSTRKSLKWYKKLGIHLMEIMLLNCFIIFQRYSGVTMDLLYYYRKSVIRYLIGSEAQLQRTPPTSGGAPHSSTSIPFTSRST